MLCTFIYRVIPVLTVVLGYFQRFRDSGNILVPLDLLFCDLDSDLRKLVQFENREKIWSAEPLFFSGLSIIIFFLLLTTFLKGQKIEAL